MTIVGAGGIGKTSLAHAVGRRVVGLFEHGVWWIDRHPVGSVAGDAGHRRGGRHRAS
jgi:predicted ATPase